MLNFRAWVKAIENQNQQPQNEFSVAFCSFGQSPKALESCPAHHDLPLFCKSFPPKYKM